MKDLLKRLGGFSAAMDRKTAIQRTADNTHVWWLRYVITPLALLQNLCEELADKADEDTEAIKAVVSTFAQFDLYISFPVNQITAGLALPNTGRGMVLMGGPSVEEGGTVVMPSVRLSTIGVEKLLSLPQAQEAADVLAAQISEELKTPFSVNLSAKIAERQITNSEAAQRKDAKAGRADQRRGYQPTQRRATGSTEQPAFSGPSGRSGAGEELDIPGL